MSHQAWNYTPEDGFQINTKCEAHPVNTSQPQLRTSMWGSGVLARFSFMPLITGTVIVAGVLTTHFLLHIFLKKMQWSSFGGGASAVSLPPCGPTTVRSGHLTWRKPKPGCLLSIAWLFWAGFHLKFGRRWSAPASAQKKEVPPLPSLDFGTYREFTQAAAHRGFEGFNNGLRGASVAADPPDTLRSGPAASSRWVLDSRGFFPLL